MRSLGLRGRLTLLYGTLFLLAGILTLAVLYLVVQDRLDDELGSGAAEDRIAALRLGAAESGQDTITLPDGSTMRIDELAAQIRQDREQVKDTALESLLVQGILVVLAVGLLAGATGWVVAGRALRPLHSITDTAERIARSSGPDRDLSERIAMVGRRDDVKRLADSFDAMLAAIDTAFDTQRRFVANASHELRTPLTIERALIELEMTKPSAPAEIVDFAGTLLRLNEKNTQLIERLLVLADSANPIELPVDVDLAQLAGLVVSDTAGNYGPFEVRTDLDPAPTSGDPVLLEQVVRNLVENAFVHNVPEGWVQVATRSVDGAAELSVSNSGPVIATHEEHGLFEPFRRNRTDRTTDTQKNGFGLGLAIVKAVTDAHHGTISATPREHGGLDVCVRLPSTPGAR